MRTTVQALEGVGRFVIGLAADVKVVEGRAGDENAYSGNTQWPVLLAPSQWITISSLRIRR